MTDIDLCSVDFTDEALLIAEAVVKPGTHAYDACMALNALCMDNVDTFAILVADMLFDGARNELVRPLISAARNASVIDDVRDKIEGHLVSLVEDDCKRNGEAIRADEILGVAQGMMGRAVL